MSWVDFGQRSCGASSMKLKAFLTDQTIIAGIGNIYTDEILFDAGLRYDRDTDTLSTQEIRRLYRSLVEILHEAIKYGGSTLGRRASTSTSTASPASTRATTRSTTVRSNPAAAAVAMTS